MTTSLNVVSNGRFRKWLGRFIWLLIALPAIWLTIAGVPFRYTQLFLQSQWFQSELGLQTPPEVAAIIVLIIEAMVGLVFLMTSAFFAWFKSADRIGLMVAFALLSLAATFPGMTDAVIDETMTTRWLPWAWFIFSLRAVSSTMSIILFYLLPDGRFVPRWTKLLGPVWIILCVIWLLIPQAPFSVVYGESFRATETASIIFVTAWWLSGVAALAIRFRSSVGQVRQQLKWVIFGMGLAGLGQLSYLFIRPLHTALGFSSDLYIIGRPVVSSIFFTFLPVCITIAIFRYRLWQIDLFINRTLVYGILTAATMGIYVFIVGGFGALLQTEGSAAIAFIAAGVVAVLFQPLRLRLQTAVDRLMYGQRDDPVGMLTELAHRLETVDRPDRILPTLVETIATALKLPYAALWLPERESRWQPVAVYGQTPDEQHMIPLLHQKQEVGRLFVAPRGPGERFSREDERLLATIGQLSAVTVQATRLSTELQDSRRQLVTSREEERRRLRRDLHDGLGPVLASIGLQADTARDLVETDSAETKEILNSIMSLAQTSVDDVRRLVYNLRPPALDEMGLVGALRHTAQAYQYQVNIHFEIGDLPTLSAAVEVAAYRIVQEALNNVVRHAGAENCRVAIQSNEELRLVIEDDGVGIADSVVSGVGLLSMKERAAELGGTCTIHPLPTGGTRVEALLPLQISEN